MRLFLSFLLLMRLACHAQTITGASTDERGYKLYIYLTGLDHDYLVPYDLEGYPRSPRDPAGPYAAGNRRKGAAFIWN